MNTRSFMLAVGAYVIVVVCGLCVGIALVPWWLG